MDRDQYQVEKRIQELESELSLLKTLSKQSKRTKENEEESMFGRSYNKCDLKNVEIEKYSRQMILPEIGVDGQLKLKNSSVLIVGTGGLGCPAAMYLTSAGLGTIGLVDYDVVDLSNLHRQTLHTEDKVGLAKVDSAIDYLRRLNSSANLVGHKVSLNSSNAMEIINKYNLVLDCTDNVATRYLLNDVCVFAKKPLVSGSALRFEGQLIVYNYKSGPCYRCLYPKPPPPETVTNCSDGGVVGAVTGVIGSLQAMEAIKIITNQHSSFSGKMLLYDAWAGSFRSIKLRGRQAGCAVCGDEPSIAALQDYELFCGSKATDKEIAINLLQSGSRISVKEYSDILKISPHKQILIDCRPEVEYRICSLQHSIIESHLPLKDIKKGMNLDDVISAVREKKSIFVVCKRGNDSQSAVQSLLKRLRTVNTDEQNEESATTNDGDKEGFVLKDIIGGLTAWSNQIDHSFPKY